MAGGTAHCQLAQGTRRRGILETYKDWSVYKDREFLDLLLEYIYAGHADAAWQILDRAWLLDEASKVVFRKSLLRQLRKSSYWDALLSMNGAALTVPE